MVTPPWRGDTCLRRAVYDDHAQVVALLLASVGILMVAGLIAAGCATNAETGAPLRLSSSDIDARGEALEEIDRELGLLDDVEVSEYIAKLGHAVDPSVAPHLQFGVLDAPEPNAFALPSGAVIISRGLIALANSDDELAGALGHEVGHVITGHGATRTVMAAPLDAIASSARVLLGLTQTTVGDTVYEATHTAERLMIIAPVARTQESQADVTGVELAARAGYDPRALSGLLLRLDTYVGGAGDSWLDDHPPARERVTRLEAHLARVPVTRAAPPPALGLRAALDGLTLGASPFGGAWAGATLVHARYGIALALEEPWDMRHAGARLVATRDGCVLALERLDEPGAPKHHLRKAQWHKKITTVSVHADLLAAEQARGSYDDGDVQVELVFFGDSERTRLLTVVSPRAETPCGRDVKQALASMHTPTEDELAMLPVLRLRFVEALPGETVKALVHRVGSPWSFERVARLNGLSPEHTFSATESVKMPRLERARP